MELADRGGVSEGTLRRELAHLRELGYEVAYTSGYEVQEKLNLEGRSRRRPRGRGDDALLQAVAQAVESAGLWRDTGPAQMLAPRRGTQPGAGRGHRAPRKSRRPPPVITPSGDADAHLLYATRIC